MTATQRIPDPMTQSLPNGGGRRRHARTPRRTDFTGLISGVCLLLAWLCGVQLSWQYYGADLDVETQVRTARVASHKLVKKEDRDKVLKLNTTDAPPVEGRPAHGEMWGYVYLPDIDRSWSRPIWEGTDENTLNTLGAGHYESTVMPGAVGNFALAGHDTANDFAKTYGIRAGDQIIIRTPEHWYVYEATETKVVTSSDTWVVSDNAPRAERGITLTTCWPMFTTVDTGQRFITWGRFVGWADVGDGVPEALAASRMTTVERASSRLQTTSKDLNLPVTGVLSLCALVAWLILDGLAWLAFRRRMIPLWRRRSWSPLTWLIRLQAGPAGGGRALKAVSFLIRLILLVLMLAAATFALWRWACPWLASTLPFLDTPHPGAVG